MIRSILFLSYCIFYGVNAGYYSNNEEDQLYSGILAYIFEYYARNITTAYKILNEYTGQNDRSIIPEETGSSTIKGALVLPDEMMCTQCNEELKCVKSYPPEKTCQNRDIIFDCTDDDTEGCKNECVCKEGFYRNDEGDCVTSEMCDKTMCTRSNEELKCVKSYPPEKTCQNRDIIFDCTDDDTEGCKNECVCKEGFYRNDEGDCVTSEMCDETMCTQCNEELKCVKSYPPEKTCQNRNIIFDCTDDDTEVCKNECVCKEGFYRNDEGDCVTSEMCDETMCTRSNEELKCVKSYPPEKTCQNRDIIFDCTDDDTEGCKNECVCKEGFYRNDEGDCVTSEMCGKITNI
ncbi:unnamed protein product [Parnassius mnemosyne]|uniref:Uncharacterized protein n=1 Tax=Parnassius mnemosyne TaxID=213953 RepID=A0AAV1M9T4_9NEOP